MNWLDSIFNGNFTYQEVDSIPARDKLTFFSKQLLDNWYHGDVDALCMHEWLIEEQNKKPHLS